MTMIKVNDHFPENEYYEADFKAKDMAGLSVTGRVFEHCSFTKCIFNETIFDHCKFMDCSFVSCDISNAKLNASRLMSASFEDCKLLGIDWTKADWPRYASPGRLAFRRCNLEFCSFFGLVLPELIMEECRSMAVDFRQGDFSKANFTYTDLSESQFGKTKLQGADFSEATGYVMDIRDNVVKGAKFTRSEASGLLFGLGIELVD